MNQPDELLDRKQAALFLRISNRTLDRITDLPRVKVSERRILYRRRDLETYVDNRTKAAA